MSLVTLNSKDQPAFDFSNHFPQPIRLPPNAQVCVQSFRHHRNNGSCLVIEDDNVLRFMIGGPGSNDALRTARIAVGQYTGTEMAAAITVALNEATHQQTFQWLVTYVAATATDYDKFHIAATQVVAAPGSEGGKWVDFGGGGRYTINTTDVASTKITPALLGLKRGRAPSFPGPVSTGHIFSSTRTRQSRYCFPSPGSVIQKMLLSTSLLTSAVIASR